MRHASDADIPALRAIYADTRSEELACVPWPLAAKQKFLEQQFNLQHFHYLTYYTEADFLVIEYKNTVQGRYYLLRTAPEHSIVDISLMAALRGKGVGRALIEASQHEAKMLGRGIKLQVLEYNVRAKRLYDRLGFVVTDSADMYHHMRWPAASEASIHDIEAGP